MARKVLHKAFPGVAGWCGRQRARACASAHTQFATNQRPAESATLAPQLASKRPAARPPHPCCPAAVHPPTRVQQMLQLVAPQAVPRHDLHPAQRPHQQNPTERAGARASRNGLQCKQPVQIALQRQARVQHLPCARPGRSSSAPPPRPHRHSGLAGGRGGEGARLVEGGRACVPCPLPTNARLAATGARVAQAWLSRPAPPSAPCTT